MRRLRILNSIVSNYILFIIVLTIIPAGSPAQTVELKKVKTLSGGRAVSDFTTADVDDDGNLDLIVSYSADSNHPGGLFWYKGPQLESHTIWPNQDITQDRFHDMVVADFNKDGKNDLIGIKNDNLYMIKSIAVSSTTTIRKIASRPTQYQSAADMNNDGYPDIVSVYNNLIWYENGKGDHPNFIEHAISTSIGASIIYLAYLDKDNKLDIVTGGAVYWNDGGVPPVFTEDILSTTTYINDIVDIDHDNDLDLMCNLRGTNIMYWLENTNPTQRKFVLRPFANPGIGRFIDLDCDGDFDMAGAIYNPNTQDSSLAYYENINNNMPPVFTEHILKVLGSPLSGLIIAPLGVNHRWQFIVCQETAPVMPYSWLDIYDAVPLPRNNCKQWSNYH